MIAGLNNTIGFIGLDRLFCLDLVIVLFYVWWYYFTKFLRTKYDCKNTFVKVCFDFLDVFLPASIAIFTINCKNDITIVLSVLCYIISSIFYVKLRMITDSDIEDDCGCEVEHHIIHPNITNTYNHNTGIVNLKTKD